VKRINVIHATVLGLGICAIAALAIPSILARGLGVNDASFAVQGIIRLAGVLILGFAAVLWSARAWLHSAHGAPTLRVLASICGMSAVMLLAQQMAVRALWLAAIPILFLVMLALDYLLTANRLDSRTKV
jgi:hypothetical protein